MLMRKNLLSRTLVFFISFLTLILLVFAILISSNGLFTNISSPVVSAFSKVDSAISKPFSFLLNLNETILDLFTTYADNSDLKKKNLELENSSLNSKELENRVQKLEQLLDLTNSVTAKTKVSAQVISRSTVSWLDALKINKGKKNSISNGMLVLANGGLVGYISSASSHSSQVTLLTNSKSTLKISMKILTDSGDVYGVLTGYDTDSQSFVVSQLNSANSISTGDSVVTSGLDGTAVSGVSLGEVSKVEKGKDSLSTKVYIANKLDFNSIDAVTVIGD